MSTDIRTLLDEWKALADAATPGPWWWDQRGDLRPTPHDEYGLDAIIGWDAIVENPVLSDEDAAFIAASRTLVPRLLAAVEDVQDTAAAMERKGHRLRLHDHTRATGSELVTTAYALRTAIHAALIGGGDE